MTRQEMEERIAVLVARTTFEVVRTVGSGTGAPFDEFGMTEDLQQTGWVSALVAVDSWDPEGGSSFDTWIISAMRRDMFRYLNKEMDHSYNREDVDEIQWHEEQPEELIDHKPEEIMQAIVDVQRALEQVTPLQAELIAMMYFEDKSGREIADDLGMSKSEVHRQINDAFRQIRDKSQ